MGEKECPKKILIAAVNPYFLKRDYFWFKENQQEIEFARQTQGFWQHNTLVLELKMEMGFSEFLRRLSEMNYEKVFQVRDPGEFSQRGGVVDIFPINQRRAIRIEFLGNTVEGIEFFGKEIKNEKDIKKQLIKKLKVQEKFSDLSNLKKGEYLVHLDHGVGRFLGIHHERQGPKKQKYYVIEYKKGDKLYVPEGLEKKITRYVGFREPQLSRLGGFLWLKTKRTVKKEAERLAKDLLNIFAKKEISFREPYRRDELSEEVANNFDYELTPDQKKTLKEIKNDLQKTKPMDRLVCGDVGFGKTEIALRAAVRVAENQKQVALICPTTILAQQHLETFQKRLKNLPLKIACLSRLDGKHQREKVLRGLEQGEIDIVIGTHSLLVKRVKFKDLGLLIIDDEQKFGVRQKEELRKKNPALDVLYLSATPIPRTLYLALSSLKDISFIQTPPQGRQPIETFVAPFSKKIIKQAIEFELKRGGQIYFLHNKINNLQAFQKMLESLETGARIEILHAQLGESQIKKIMTKFQKQKIDLLLTTTIIENGIDIPTVNTLIVDNATDLGLAQAYQIRGRIGRKNVKARAFFLYRKGKLKDKAKQRLEELKKAKELAANYRISLADLEIRGAGNILGKEQSGSINRVGLNLYCQMLSQAIEKLKSKEGLILHTDFNSACHPQQKNYC